MPSAERRNELIQGTLDMLILQAVCRSRRHGYAIAEWIHAMSKETLQVEEGALYPALHRLELKGLLDSQWGISQTNRRVKFYNITSVGRKHLSSEREQWTRLAAGMLRVIEAN